MKRANQPAILTLLCLGLLTAFLGTGCEQKHKPNIAGRKGMLDIQAGNFPAAKKHLEEAIKASPDNMGLVNNLGAVYVQQKDYAQAIKMLERVRNSQPSYPPARYNLVGAYCMGGRPEDARREYRAAEKMGTEKEKLDSLKIVLEKYCPLKS